MESLLVTGGCGFIGSDFIRYHVKEFPEVEIVNLDALTYAGNLKNLRQVESASNYRFVKGDIRDGSLIENLFNQYEFDAVVNFAAETHVDRSIHSADEFVSTNVGGTNVLLNNALNFGKAKFLQISTDEVYGELGETGKFDEEFQLAPNSPYAATKASADFLVRSYFETHDLPVLITRTSNNYGPYQFPEKLIPLMILNAREGKKLPVYGNGENVRDWIYVRDNARALAHVLHEGKPGEVYNIGADAEKKNIEVVKAILSELNKPESLIEYVEDRPGHDFRYAIDNGKIKNELGWQSEYDFETGLRETIDWYLEHENWVEEVQSGEYKDFYEKQYKGRLTDE